jgi:hypothetical protein
MSCKMCVVVLLFNTSFFVNEYPIFALLLSSLLSSQTKDIDIIPRSMIQTTVFGVFLIWSLVCCLKFCFEIWDFIFLKISRSWHGLIILIKRSINYAGLMLREIFFLAQHSMNLLDIWKMIFQEFHNLLQSISNSKVQLSTFRLKMSSSKQLKCNKRIFSSWIVCCIDDNVHSNTIPTNLNLSLYWSH